MKLQGEVEASDFIFVNVPTDNAEDPAEDDSDERRGDMLGHSDKVEFDAVKEELNKTKMKLQMTASALKSIIDSHHHSMSRSEIDMARFMTEQTL